MTEALLARMAAYAAIENRAMVEAWGERRLAPLPPPGKKRPRRPVVEMRARMVYEALLPTVGTKFSTVAEMTGLNKDQASSVLIWLRNRGQARSIHCGSFVKWVRGDVPFVDPMESEEE